MQQHPTNVEYTQPHPRDMNADEEEERKLHHLVPSLVYEWDSERC